MKILIVSTSDIEGGAARAAYRLHNALLNEGVESQMLVQNKTSDDYTVLSENNKMTKIFNRIRPFLDSIPVRFYKKRTKTLFSPAWLPFSNIIDQINSINPDIVHLHWIAGGMIKIENLAKIKAPIIWNMQDMWPFTGGCHYDENCGGYKHNCGSCKVLQSNHSFDLSRKVFFNKYKSFSRIKRLFIVGVSQWISGCAKESTLFKEREIITLPNCFDTDLFKKIDKNFVKDIFHIPKDKKVILFGAMNSLGDPRKGAKELFEAINTIEVENTIFVIAGSSRPKIFPDLKYPIYFIPPLADEVSLPLMYNVADVMVVPSLQENLANSIIESLACGVPVVAFDIGGNSDMIEHKKNGYLARPLNSQDMAKGIEWILTNQAYETLSVNAREKVLNEFDSKVVSKKYIDLYKKIISKIQ